MRILTIAIVSIFFLQLSSFAMNADDELQKLPILHEGMTKEEWQAFARIGGGYYPIPEHLKRYLSAMIQFANRVSSMKNDIAYHCDDKHQIEYLYFEEKDWHKCTTEIRALSLGMREISISILISLLDVFDVERGLQSIITGGLSDNFGRHFLKVVHYDANKNFPGLPWHKDIRWITTLFINQPGLMGMVNGKEVPIMPLEGYFFIHLGVFFEAFINDTTQLNAFIHEVPQLRDIDRISFGVFTEGNYPVKGFYQKSEIGYVWKNADDMKAFLVEDKLQTFSSGPHNVFNSFVEK